MGEVSEVNGPIVTIRQPGVRNGDQVRIGELGLIGEVIHIRSDDALVQVYESTESLQPGEQVTGLGHPLRVELGPGMLGQIFDGVQRPLDKIMHMSGEHISRGLELSALDRDKSWHFVPHESLVVGTRFEGGEILGTVQETETIEHRILAPPDCRGEIIEHAPEGDYTIEEIVARVRGESGSIQNLKMYHHWPVRQPRPYRARAGASLPLITGQRILDTFFPMLKGGKAAVPGPFGAGKTIVQQQIARWANADIVLYVGCGERGNELVEILQTFPQLTDPRSGRSLMERTFLVANTSNMPVVAREASIYVGVTMAEYYRDQGYDVVMVADSTSRWAEALREVAGRLGQMPVEEGYPAYLASRLAAFYERAGNVDTLAGGNGSVSLIGAVSPPGGDFSEPVTSHTKEIIRTFWALSKPLADARHYPAVSWLESFTDYAERAAIWWADEVSPDWALRRQQALTLLTEADELERIVNLVGPEALSASQRWVLESSGLIKEAVLQQSALDAIDSYCSPQKQFRLLDLVLSYHLDGTELISLGVPVESLTELPYGGELRRLKSAVSNDDLQPLDDFASRVRESFDTMRTEYSVNQGNKS
ncbi:MAG: V-type ATP synthase subunit A [Gammaproteobacteria bacterium]|nr:MAG: V-type ATP synthase subunit A [Gammaproteobacteria bacterium]UCH39923.1 MAG: V-type ATP synthase subunit A [Gammaproteobacteria bacterium]